MEFLGLLVVAGIFFTGGLLYERKKWQKATKKNRAEDVR